MGLTALPALKSLSAKSIDSFSKSFCLLLCMSFGPPVRSFAVRPSAHPSVFTSSRSFFPVSPSQSLSLSRFSLFHCSRFCFCLIFLVSLSPSLSSYRFPLFLCPRLCLCLVFLCFSVPVSVSIFFFLVSLSRSLSLYHFLGFSLPALSLSHFSWFSLSRPCLCQLFLGFSVAASVYVLFFLVSLSISVSISPRGTVSLRRAKL